MISVKRRLKCSRGLFQLRGLPLPPFLTQETKEGSGHTDRFDDLSFVSGSGDGRHALYKPLDAGIQLRCLPLQREGALTVGDLVGRLVGDPVTGLAGAVAVAGSVARAALLGTSCAAV